MITEYYATKHPSSDGKGYYYLHASPSRFWVSLHKSPHPIVKLEIRERTEFDPPSAYWAWIASDKPDKFIFIWPSETQLEICFPCGTKPAEAAGHGRKVNVVITEIESG